MKRVLIFSTAYLPHVGGAEVAIGEITDRLPDFKWEMITVRLDRADKARERIGNIEIHRIGLGLGRIDKMIFPFRAARLAKRLHREKKYDIVWSMMASFSGFAALFFKKKNPEVKFLLTLQEGDDLKAVEKKTSFARSWFYQIFQKADLIQALSGYLEDWARKMGARCPIEIVPNGADFEKIKNKNEKIKTDELKRRLGIKEGERVIVTTSRLAKKNGIGDLIKAMTYLETNDRLVIVGGGELEGELRRKIADFKLDGRVIMVGAVKPEEIPGYLAIADVFCRPSLSEGLGNSFLEAMAAGAPVVATAVGGIPDFLEDGRTGWFCEVGNPKSVAEKIGYALDEKNREAVEEVVKNAEVMIKEKYDWGKIAEKMKAIFLKI